MKIKMARDIYRNMFYRMDLKLCDPKDQFSTKEETTTIETYMLMCKDVKTIKKSLQRPIK